MNGLTVLVDPSLCDVAYIAEAPDDGEGNGIGLRLDAKTLCCDGDIYWFDGGKASCGICTNQWNMEGEIRVGVTPVASFFDLYGVIPEESEQLQEWVSYWTGIPKEDLDIEVSK